MQYNIDVRSSSFNSTLKLKGFNVFAIDEDLNETRTYSRKDFYKICLSTGDSIIHYSDRSFRATGTVLFFANPHIPYSWETLSAVNKGFSCLFSEEFYSSAVRSESLQQSPLFKLGGTPIIEIKGPQIDFLETMFKNMIREQATDYHFKDDLMRNYINLITHEALKHQPLKNFENHKNAASRISAVFLELVERQFPIESVSTPLTLRMAQDYADRLGIHVNYLNRSVKEITGKSTTTLISDRVISEAKSLLQHTDWSISEIAFALGFEYPSYFNNFFKSKTALNPTLVRNSFKQLKNSVN